MSADGGVCAEIGVLGEILYVRAMRVAWVSTVCASTERSWRAKVEVLVAIMADVAFRGLDVKGVS
jgi:hypothetical protein